MLNRTRFVFTIVAQVLTSTLAIVPSVRKAITSNWPSDLVASIPASSSMWQTKYSPARPILMERRSLKGLLSDSSAYYINTVAFGNPLNLCVLYFHSGLG